MMIDPTPLTLEEQRVLLRNTLAMLRADGHLPLAPRWGLACCKCREADGFILATEFDLRLAVVTDPTQLQCGTMVLCQIREEEPVL